MTYKKKLIEVALPLASISEAAAKEKTLKNSHPANLHLWWARRPLAAARGILWASLVNDPSADPARFPDEESQATERQRLFRILERLVPWEASDDSQVLAEARAEILASCDGELPRVLDPFGGGGAIPLEASRLGLTTFSGDLNPVAVLIQRAMLELPGRFWNQRSVHPDSDTGFRDDVGLQGLASDVVNYGMGMLARAFELVGQTYPIPEGAAGLGSPIAWIWARTVPSPDPSWQGHVPLVRSWVLAKRSGRSMTWIEPIVDRETQEISYVIRHGGTPPTGTVSSGRATCLATGAPMSSSYLREQAMAGGMSRQLLAVAVDSKDGRRYFPGSSEDQASADASSPAWRPSGSLPPAGTGLGFRVQRYGFTEWSDLYTARQLSTLTTLSDLLPEVHEKVLKDAVDSTLDSVDERGAAAGGRGPTAYADAIVTYLALALDKLADLNNSLTAWEPIAQCPRHLFGRQVIAMTWDYAEANPFSSSSGSLKTVLDGIRRTLEGRGLHDHGTVSVEQRDARARVRELAPTVVSTDPPYYDNVGYADLSDFFFVWLRRSLWTIWPDETATLATPKTDELIADSGRSGSKDAALRHFEDGMSEFFSAVHDGADHRYPATVYYAFKATEDVEGTHVSTGWETFLTAMVGSGLTITATWPVRTENKSRLRGMNSNALASSIVLACRPRESTATLATRGEFIAALKSEMAPAVRILQVENIAPVDLAQSAIGPGIAIFSRYARVIEADGSEMTVRAALVQINDVLAEILSGEESEFDSDTRFAITWFEQFGHESGPFGDADLLARAKDTTVAGVCEAGIALSRDGHVRLLKRSELPAGWDPANDRRLTVWETVQHLIRSIESSEDEVSALIARLGEGLSERARQLSYLLYGICDRNRWPEEAGPYNMLVTAWPEVSRLAAARVSSNASQEAML